MARKKKAAVATIPTSRNLSVAQLQRVGACEGALHAFEAIFGEKTKITPRIVEKLTNDQVVILGQVAAYWVLSREGQDKFFDARRRVRRATREPWNLGYAERCRRHLRLLARYYIRYPRRFAA